MDIGFKVLYKMMRHIVLCQLVCFGLFIYAPSYAQNTEGRIEIENNVAQSKLEGREKGEDHAEVGASAPSLQKKKGPLLTNVQNIDTSVRISASLEIFKTRLDTINEALENDTIDDEALVTFLSELENIDGEILSQVIVFQPEVLELKARLNSFPAVAETAHNVETKAIVKEQEQLSQEYAKVIAALKEAEFLSVKGKNTRDKIFERRRSEFVTSLFSRHALGWESLIRVYQETGQRIKDFWHILASWVNTLLASKSDELIFSGFILFIYTLVLRRILRGYRRWVAQIDSLEEISRLQKITLAFWKTIVPSFAFAGFVYFIHYLCLDFGLYRLRINEIIPAFLKTLAGFVFFVLLLNAVLEPFKAKWRIMNVGNGIARRLFVLGVVMALVYGLDSLLSQMIMILNIPPEFGTVKNILAIWLMSLVMILIITSDLEPRLADGRRPQNHGWNKFLYWGFWGVIVFVNGCVLFGYVKLGHFLAAQVLITGSIIVTMCIGFMWAHALADRGGFISTQLGRYLQTKYNLSEFRLDQISFVLSLLIDLAVVLVGFPVILLQWGFNREDLTIWGDKFFTGFSIGGFNVSIGRIVLALVVFFLLISLTRIIQRWFDNKVLVRTQLDSGVKNSVRSGVGYIGFFIAAIVGVSWAGFNLSNLAIIAGALSVGIGFGLQNIVNNFVSGIIMLIERPIKVGDIISVAGAEGYVRKINVRATELETFDRQSVIIPNSEVINTSVGNWMHKDTMRRIIIPIGVAYGSDIEKVRTVLLDLVAEDKRIAKQPGPFVYFAGFGDCSLDFELRFFVYDLMTMLSVETDIRFALDKAFQENNIEIPYPRRDLYLHKQED